jgi:hypothetical protein
MYLNFEAQHVPILFRQVVAQHLGCGGQHGDAKTDAAFPAQASNAEQGTARSI